MVSEPFCERDELADAVALAHRVFDASVMADTDQDLTERAFHAAVAVRFPRLTEAHMTAALRRALAESHWRD